MLNDTKTNKINFLVCTLGVFAMVFAGASFSHATNADIRKHESQTLDLLSRIDAFSDRDPILAEDSAKAHYNMGNIYFQKGEYEIAAREYYQAVTLMPNDSDSHYNLAYVSNKHLNDFETALKHWINERKFLYTQIKINSYSNLFTCTF